LNARIPVYEIAKMIDRQRATVYRKTAIDGFVATQFRMCPAYNSCKHHSEMSLVVQSRNVTKGVDGCKA